MHDHILVVEIYECIGHFNPKLSWFFSMENTSAIKLLDLVEIFCSFGIWYVSGVPVWKSWYGWPYIPLKIATMFRVEDLFQILRYLYIKDMYSNKFHFPYMDKKSKSSFDNNFCIAECMYRIK